MIVTDDVDIAYQMSKEEAWTVISALSVYSNAHRESMENSPFPETQEHSRREWLKAVDLLNRLDPVKD
jgi:hypothetical protein